MQFKHPEVLYFLALLILPILVHLFQLQKFKKIPFTNVAFLQKLVLQTRKSSKLKKWLILATRLLGLSALIFAFSQPFFSNKKSEENQHNFIYLDNSLSTNSKGEKGNLLEIAKQDIIENTSEADKFSLQTNDEFYPNLSSKELKNILLKVENSSKKLSLEDILLKIESKKTNSTKTSNKNILISDFQNNYKNNFTIVNSNISLISLKNSQQNNIFIDSIWVNENSSDNFTLNINVKNQGDTKENIPIAIFNNQKLISKQSFSIEKDNKKKITFSLQKQDTFLGKIEITFSDTFSFDNTAFFTTNSNQKINVLSIGKRNSFLSRIYASEEFNYTNNTIQNINYNAIPKQQLIVLNGLEEINQSLISALVDFTSKGGHLVVIPNTNSKIDSYNLLLKNLSVGEISSLKKDTLKVTNINFKHPLFKDVFVKSIKNFQYPTSQSYYPTQFSNTSAIISFEDKKPFIQQLKSKKTNIYFINSPLEKENNNFINSPLVVPVFYNIAQKSLQFSKPYYTIGEENKIDINTQLNKDDILSISNKDFTFIPLQQTYQNKVTLTTNEKPLKAGIYHVLKQKDTLSSVAYNHNKEESALNFLDVNTLKENKNIKVYNTITEVFNEIKQENKVHWLWQLFLTLAIVSLLLEILILKFFKA